MIFKWSELLGFGMFRFKQFDVVDGNSAMKVGMDSVLLGAWIDVDGAKNVLDIGSGCGLLSLMIAQRNREARITGVEVSLGAVQDSMFNFGKSDWSDRLLVVNEDITQYDSPVRFDVIVSNPPYFESNDGRFVKTDRGIARHDGLLSFDALLGSVVRLMSAGGRFSLVLPYDCYHRFGQIAADKGLFERRKLCVIPKKGRGANRVILEYGREMAKCASVQNLCLRDEDGNFSRELNDLTRDFYLTDI